ncbi:MAG: 2-oxo acid dehydrogenase subunit E2, partial [Actinobacteria bacterium]|nr:2-oxo acid dehydrogenase subunit E2 [Actinomycetota bacterium]
GYLAEILVPEGGTVEVGATLAVIADAPPGSDDAGPAREEAPSTSAAPEPPVAPDPSGGGEGRDNGTEAPLPESAPVAAREAGDTGSSPKGPSPDPAATSFERSSGPRLLSPVVRRLVAEHELDPDAIIGTGAGGRITRNDVLALIDSGDRSKTRPAQSRPAPAPAPTPTPTASRAPLEADHGDEVVPFSNIRRRTAEHMRRSKATSAHALIVIEVNYEGVDRVRLAEKDRFKAEEGVNLTYLPFVSRAVVDALREFPLLNASVGEEELVVHRAVHLGFAVDLHFEGLMVPVIHGADGKRLRVLAREVAELAIRARSRKLGPDDIAGGTFTITNPGPFGTLVTGAIINQPQVAILATDGVAKRPVVVELPDGSDAIAVHPVGNLALTFDHRAVDGAYVAAFLAKVKQILETRDWAAELA